VSKAQPLKLTPEHKILKVAEAAIRHFNRIDLLVNSAGIYIPKPFTEYTPRGF